ncbi:hypothetical protein VTL71DRAFT_4757 [Oculimacula yallundae]|uniref:Uncharacterized protein n=1 Tax=Oculimacula yallundae TaxID=86028 RepID=A0ABR4C301_9HELO
MSPSDTPPIVSIISGGIAGGVEGFLTYPFEFAKTRAQLGQLPSTNTTSIPSSNSITASSTLPKTITGNRNGNIKTSSNTSSLPSKPKAAPPKPSRNPYLLIGQIYKNEGGIRALYKGCTVMVIGSVGKDAVRFLSFDTVKNYFRTEPNSVLTPGQNMLAGMSAGVLASLCAVTPTERVKTALIDDARMGSAQQYSGTGNAIRSILKEDGIRGLYRGLVGTTLKQASSTGLRMGTYNICKEWEIQRGVEQGTMVNFANGALAGIVTTLGSMPFDTIKTR